MPARFEVKLSPEFRLRVAVSGILDEPTALELEQEVLSTCQTFPPRSLEVLINLLGTTSCTLEARPVLVHMQQELASRAWRTAYVDERPSMRGMALWVMHLAGDGNARAVPSEAEAELWLQGCDDFSESARMGTAAA